MRSATGVLLFVLVTRAFAQDSSEVTDGFRRVDGGSTRKTLATAAVGFILLTTTYDDYNVWWKAQPKGFSFFSDRWLSGGQLGTR